VSGIPATVSRTFTFAILVALTVVTWVFLVRSEAVMTSMEGSGLLYDVAVAMMDPSELAPYFAASILMWTAMMVAMMVPAALPVVSVFSRLDRSAGGGRTQVDTAFFAGGYLAMWIVFGLAATLVQWMLHRSGYLEGHLLALPAVPGAILLIATGLYQFSRFKTACLSYCQNPLSFLLANWRDGATGALAMGARHGLHCLGCCWMLMLLMFTYGVMSAAAMAALTLFVIAERKLPDLAGGAELPGMLLIAWGTASLAWTLAS
jgi:predicted metal-binding membrane protein